MRLFKAREKGKTQLGNRWVALQDFDNSLHISVQRGDVVAYEHIQVAESKEKMLEVVESLEKELYPKMLTAGETNG